MGRPSKKQERTEEILQAFQRCVARFGLEGSSLERIAEEAGLQRSLVRHFVGNRDDLIAMLADRVIAQSDAQWSAFLEMLPPQGAVEALLEGLFHEASSDPEFVLVIESLIFASSQKPELQQLMQQWLKRFTDDVTGIIARDFPQNSAEDLSAVAFGIVSLYFNLDSLAPIGLNDQYREPAFKAAQRLINSLSN